MVTRSGLVDDLRRLGVAPGDVVLAHASLRAIGDVAGGPDQVHLALTDAITSDGTLVMYASCPRFVDEIGRGNLSPEEEREVFEKLPAFDAQTARSARDNGSLVEFFRTWPGARVNDHVARFVVRGKQAHHLITEQPWNFAFGSGSLLDRFTALGGKILLLGSDHDNVTYLHYAEHVGDFPGKRIARFKVPVLEEGRRVWRDMAEVDTAERAHDHWPDRFFARIIDGFIQREAVAAGLVGRATSHLLPARKLLAYALGEMQRVATGAPVSRP